MSTLLGLALLLPAAPPAVAVPDPSAFFVSMQRRRVRLPRISDEDFERVEEMLDQLAEKIREARPPASVTEKAIRKALPARSALIDFIEYEGIGKERGLRLLAVVYLAGRTERVELGAAAPVRAAIDAYLASLSADPPGKIDGLAGKALRKRVWEPVARHVAGAERVLLVPDGCLYELPFAALPGEREGTWLVEEHCLELLRSPANLLEARSKPATGAPLLVGDVPHKAFADAVPLKDADRRSLAKEVGKRRPRVLHLSGPGLGGKGPRSAAMLLGGDAKSLLTALDAAELPLEGCGLVVLTGHGTGRTAYARGEGGLGMPRAFGMAGARHVVSALWNTSDAATALLMERFYAGLWEKKLSPAQALRAAQVEMLRNPGAKASDWAGFMAYTQGG